MQPICTKQNHLTLKMNASLAYINALVCCQETDPGSFHTHTCPRFHLRITASHPSAPGKRRDEDPSLYVTALALREISHILRPRNELKVNCADPHCFQCKGALCTITMHEWDYKARGTACFWGGVYKVLRIPNLDWACSYSCCTSDHAFPHSPNRLLSPLTTPLQRLEGNTHST